MGVKTLAVLQFEFRAMMARRGFLIATAAFPLIGLAIILVVRLITSMGEDGPSALGYFLLGYFFFASVLAGVGAMATTPQESSQLGTFVTLPAAVPFFILSFIIGEPNGTIARVLTFIPLTAPLTAMLRLSAATPPWPDLLGGAVVLVASTVAVIFLSARVFRAFVLLYGRRPGLAEFWRALRASG